MVEKRIRLTRLSLLLVLNLPKRLNTLIKEWQLKDTEVVSIEEEGEEEEEAIAEEDGTIIMEVIKATNIKNGHHLTKDRK